MQIERFGTVPLPVTAVRLTEDNLDEVAQWCHGQVMGIKLPRADQLVEFWSRDEEHRAEIGNWIVSYTEDTFYPYTDEIFQQRFISY